MKIYDKLQIKKEIESFDNQKIEEARLTTRDLIFVKFDKPIINVYEDNFAINTNVCLKFSNIKSIEIDELEEYARLAIYFEETIISFLYKNI